MNDRDGQFVLFDHNLDAGAHPCQHSGKVAGRFDLRDVNYFSRHGAIITVSDDNFVPRPQTKNGGLLNVEAATVSMAGFTPRECRRICSGQSIQNPKSSIAFSYCAANGSTAIT